MKTPICDFLHNYAENDVLRLHMPGHKGAHMLGNEMYDITEISGADSLYEANGIISESEKNASRIFGANTFYSVEGSSQCIRAMLYLAVLFAKQNGKRPLIASARNVHKTFVSAAALLDFDVAWLCPENEDSYLSCTLSSQQLDNKLSEMAEKPTAVYLTSPDYLGNIADIRSIAQVCHRYGILLLVDNAHGAYLKFLPDSLHPTDLGADMCCDSAHKTLPVLTGGAYLHISVNAPNIFSSQAKNALAMFGSTSPSYLILRSLDYANKYLTHGYAEGLSDFISDIQKTKEKLLLHGYTIEGNEPLKITVRTKKYGYTGTQLAEILLKENIVCEFSDPDFTVMMLTPEIGAGGLKRLEQAMLSISQKTPIEKKPPAFSLPTRAMPIRDAVLSPSEEVPVADSIGKTAAVTSVGCPPAVPIIVSGEIIDANTAECFSYYGIKTCTVVKSFPPG